MCLSNPFNWELLRLLKKYESPTNPLHLCITEPRNILAFFKGGVSATQQTTAAPVAISDIEKKLRERYQPAEDTSATALDGSTEESEPLIILVNQLIENAYTHGCIGHSHRTVGK